MVSFVLLSIKLIQMIQTFKHLHLYPNQCIFIQFEVVVIVSWTDDNECTKQNNEHTEIKKIFVEFVFVTIIIAVVTGMNATSSIHI